VTAEARWSTVARAAAGSAVLFLIVGGGGGCRLGPATSRTQRDGSPAPSPRLTPNPQGPYALRWVEQSRSLWVSAPLGKRTDTNSWQRVWRVVDARLGAEVVASPQGGQLDATYADGQEVAAWTDSHNLKVWRGGALETVPECIGNGPLRLRWSVHAQSLAWLDRGDPGGAVQLRLYMAGSGAVSRHPLPQGAEPIRGTAPVWSQDGTSVGVPCRDVPGRWRLVTLGCPSGEWRIWRRPLPDRPMAADYVARPDEEWVAHRWIVEVPAGATCILLGYPGEVTTGYSILLPDELREAGAPDSVPYAGRAFAAPAPAIKTMSQDLSRIAYITQGESGTRRLEEPWRDRPGVLWRSLPLPRDAPEAHEVAFGADGVIHLLAGSPGNWRVLIADFEEGTVQEFVRLP